MSKKKEKELKFSSLAIVKLKDGYYKLIDVDCFADGTYEIFSESQPATINNIEDLAHKHILHTSIRMQQK